MIWPWSYLTGYCFHHSLKQSACFLMFLQNLELFLIHLNWASVLFLLFVLERLWLTSISSDVTILGIRCPRNLTIGQRKIYFKHFGSNFVHYCKSFILCIWDIAAMADKESGRSFYPLLEYCTILKGKSGHEKSNFLGRCRSSHGTHSPQNTAVEQNGGILSAIFKALSVHRKSRI